MPRLGYSARVFVVLGTTACAVSLASDAVLAQNRAAPYPNLCAGPYMHIREIRNVRLEKVISLDDNSSWLLDSFDEFQTTLWMASDKILAVPDRTGEIVLVNVRRLGRSDCAVKATLLN